MEQIKDNIASFSTAQITDTFNFKNFMQSNSIVAKVVFLLLAVIVFMLLMRLGIQVINWLFNSTKITLVKGMIDAKNTLIYSQDPSSNPYTLIPRSVNESDGIEFSWSCWIYINSYEYLKDKYKHIFYKGNNDINENGLNMPNNAPGLYLTPYKNNLIVIMNTFNKITREILVSDIPINKWVNIVLRCSNNILDVYINGVITRSIELGGVPKQNDGDVYVAANGGFDGYISNLTYYAYSLTINQIAAIVKKGPSLNVVAGNGSSLQAPTTDYLSLNWYIYGGR